MFTQQKLLSFTILATIVSLQCDISTAYNILGLFPYPGKSHFDVFVPLLRELARRGHNVTVISHFPENNPLPNYKDISLVGATRDQILLEVVDASLVRKIQKVNDILATIKLSAIGEQNCESLNSTPVQNLIHSNATFDVIIHEHFNSDCFLALVHIFKAPHLGISSCTQMPWHYERFGAPLITSYVPNNLLYYSDKMTFFERVHNTVATFLHNRILVQFLSRRPNNQIVQKYLKEYNVPDLDTIAKNTSVMLVNSHYSLNLPRPLPPNVIEVSGIHLPNKNKQLPQDIQKFINDAKDGVIYVSFGSMVKATTFPEEERNKFLAAFAEIPQRVLWKYENESLPGKSDNVLIRKWMPQFDILSHPNVRAYIAHGGLLGTIEGVYNGVPMITMPFFGDQFTNTKALERRGTSFLLDINKLTKEKILSAIKFALDPRTKEKAQLLKKAFHDRPMSAMDTAVWWVEYVARNGGASSLRSAVIDMPYYQSSLLDVYLFLFVILCIVIYVNVKLVSFIYNKLFRQKKVKTL